jgi:hypothetical protein
MGATPPLEKWTTIDMCTGATEKTDDLCETYTGCQSGVAVSLCSIPGADHVLYENAQGVSLPKVSEGLLGVLREVPPLVSSEREQGLQ